jgi:two-component system, cell cycle sensor histidine kinase and response regulator CckA
MNTVVFILEDDVSNMQIFSALLWATGYSVLEATDGQEAIDTSRRHGGAIDLLLSDIAVPGRSGTEVALELMVSHPSMAILFVSGTPMNQWELTDLRNFRRLPPERVDVLEKPFRPTELLDRIGKLLGTVTHPIPALTMPMHT